MDVKGGWFSQLGLAMAGRRSPWGRGPVGEREADAPAGEEGGAPPNAEDAPPGRARGPRNPWLPPANDGEPPRRSANIEDIFRARAKRGGGGGEFPRFPQRPGGKSWFPFIVAGIAAVWLFATSVHQVGPKEQGIVTTFGSYSRTIGPGVSLSLPWPIQNVSVTDVTSIRRDSIPEGEAEKLMLTGDQNLVDLSYLVRWNIKDLKLYRFQLAEPDETVTEVAEAAMRASIAEVTLNQAMGAGRASIEQNVRERMQSVLDAYRSGVLVQGVEIQKADPPTKVVDAFKEVLASQQDAQSAINRAQAWAQQLTARAEGEAEAFDRVYQEYRLAPEVTRRRMYYETMERVLSQTDKTIVQAPNVESYLPLPELRRRQQQPAQQQPQAEAAQ